ncbi:MAG: holo-ACP synthase [Candidatus Humimicrobiaceae bacterium]
MNIFGIGSDLIEVDRIKNAIESHPRFLKKIYTEKEINYCETKSKNRFQSYASRFAGKEAVAKSVHQGLGKFLFFNEIEILDNDYGYPFVSVHGLTYFYFLTNNIADTKITLSSTRSFCIAYAISLIKREGQKNERF